jgi:hypothetical protein
LRTRPLRRPAIGLGGSYLAAIVLLGPLLGSSADASTAFADHFDDTGNRLRDLVGSLALLIAAAMLVWTAVVARHTTVAREGSSVRDLSAAAAAVTASAVVAASGLLLTVPLTTLLGDLTDDPGIDVGVQAGIAQAGTVVLLVAALCLAVTTVLLARLGRQNGTIPGWISPTAWATAATLCLGLSVALLLPFGAWAIALGAVWSSAGSDETSRSAGPAPGVS